MKHYYDTFSTPLGDFSIAFDGTDAVVATAFGGATELRKRFDADELIREPGRATVARRQVREFLAGRRQRFALKLAPSGTAFQQRVWSALRRIPFGQTRSYGDLAAELGFSRAARAVGSATAANPFCLLIPCHRAVGADGSLTGFAFGTELKRQLIDIERRQHAAKTR